MNTESEPFSASRETYSVVEKCVSKIKSDKSMLIDWLDTYVFYHKGRIALDIEIIKNNVSLDSSVLEFGSVPLLFTSSLREMGYNIKGVDIDPARFATTIQSLGLEVLKCDIEHEILPIEDNSYDVVVFNELFEHLRVNLIFTLSEVFRVLKPGGKLFLSSPNLRSLDGIINFLFKNQAYSCSGDVYEEYRKLNTLGHMGHVREYTSKEVLRFLNRIGFQKEKLIYRGQLSTKPRNLAARLRPALRPFITYVVTKPVN